MKVSKETKEIYRKVIMDSLYTDLDKWIFIDCDYPYYSIFRAKYLKYTINIYRYHIINKIEITLKSGDSFNMNLRNLELKYLYRRMKKYVFEKNKTKYNENFINAVPITLERRLKIEKIYKEIPKHE
jgi:hypothetical protein